MAALHLPQPVPGARDRADFTRGPKFELAHSRSGTELLFARCEQEGRVPLSARRLCELACLDSEVPLRMNEFRSGTLIAYGMPDKKLGEEIIFKDPASGYLYNFPVPDEHVGAMNIAFTVGYPSFYMKEQGMRRYVCILEPLDVHSYLFLAPNPSLPSGSVDPAIWELKEITPREGEILKCNRPLLVSRLPVQGVLPLVRELDSLNRCMLYGDCLPHREVFNVFEAPADFVEPQVIPVARD